MFGMGGTEILVILIVALLFLGPDKLPEAAKSISKGIRDIKKQSRVLQRTIEEDEHIGGAIRDLKSALRGEDEPYRPPPPRPRKELESPQDPAPDLERNEVAALPHGDAAQATGVSDPAAADAPALPALTLPPTAGEPDGPVSDGGGDAELASLVKPAPNTIARGAAPAPGKPESEHG